MRNGKKYNGYAELYSTDKPLAIALHQGPQFVCRPSSADFTKENSTSCNQHFVTQLYHMVTAVFAAVSYAVLKVHVFAVSRCCCIGPYSHAALSLAPWRAIQQYSNIANTLYIPIQSTSGIMRN